MAKRQLTRADKELLEQVDVLLEPGEGRPSATMLERWRQAGILPSPERIESGVQTRYPQGTAEQVVALMRLLKVHGTLAKTALPLFMEGYRVRANLLRPPFLRALDQFEEGFRSSVAKLRAKRGLREKRLAPFEIATFLAAEWRSQAAKRRASDPMALQMIAHLGKPTPLTAEEPEENFELLFAHLFYVWLTGRTMPYAESVIEQLAVAGGLQDLVDGALSQLNLDEYGRGLVANVPEGVRASSLPALRRAVSASDVAAFERARDDYPILRDALAYFRAAIRIVFDVDVVEHIFGMEQVENLGPRMAMLQLLALQRLRHYGAMVEALERQLQGAPPLAALALVDSDALLAVLQQSFKELDQSPGGNTGDR